MIKMMRGGNTKELIEMMPEFTEQSVAETDGGALTWMLSSLNYPNYPATIHEYGTIIGTGNVIAAWDTTDEKRNIQGVSKQ